MKARRGNADIGRQIEDGSIVLSSGVQREDGKTGVALAVLRGAKTIGYVAGTPEEMRVVARAILIKCDEAELENGSVAAAETKH